MFFSILPHACPLWYYQHPPKYHFPLSDRLIFFPNGLPKLKQQRPKAKPRPKPKPKAKPKPKPRQKHHGINGTELMTNNIEYHDEPNGLNDPEDEANETEDEDPDGDGNGTGHHDDDDDDDEEEDDDYDDRIRAEIYSNYPHYLHPPSWGINNPLVLASHSPHTLDDDDDVVVEVVTNRKPPSSSHHHNDELEHDVVVVVDAGPHSHSHPHQHTYYSHGDQSSTTGSGPPGPAPTIPSPPKYAAGQSCKSSLSPLGSDLSWHLRLANF